MPRRRRTIVLALLALAIPLPALALPGERDATPPPVPLTLSVSTALDSCGVADSQVVCKLDVGFNTIPGATSYTASVTRADGSVVDYGAVGAGGGSLWVPYTGSGTYSVRISAYGTPPEAEPGGSRSGNALITSEATEAEGVGANDTGNSEPDGNPGAGGGPAKPNAVPADDPGAEAGAPAAEDPAAVPATPDAPPSNCEPQPPPAEEPLPEPPPPDSDPNDPDEDGDGIDDAEERAAYELALAEQTAAALAAEAELPEAIDCAEAARP